MRPVATAPCSRHIELDAVRRRDAITCSQLEHVAGQPGQSLLGAGLDQATVRLAIAPGEQLQRS